MFKLFLKRNTISTLSLLFLSTFSLASYLFAAPPLSQYNPGETLDPACAPTSANCNVRTLPPQTLADVGKFLQTDGTTTNWITTITSLNGQTGTSQTFANGSSGTAPAFTSSANTHTLNIPSASGAGVTAGLISKANFDTFNNKEPAITAGTAQQYYRGDKTFQTLDTDAVPDTTSSTNKYFSNALADARVSALAILNQTTQQASSNFNISGTGIIGSALTIGSNTTANTSAVLDLISTNKGLLLPRVVTPSSAITGNVAGLVAYDSNTNQLQFNNGTTWQALGVAGSGLQSINGLTANNQTIDAINNASTFLSFARTTPTGSSTTFTLGFSAPLPVANGGTGIASFPVSNGLIYSPGGTANLTQVAAGSSGQFLALNGTTPTWTGAVDLTSAQSIGGVKTFTSFPKSTDSLSNLTNGQQLVTKAYVDTFNSGLSLRAAVRAATTVNLSVTSGGPAGVGHTLTANPNVAGALIVDGVTMATNDRLLVKNQGTGTDPDNGIYTVTNDGSGGGYVLTRSADYDQTSEVTQGSFMNVISGTVNANTQWALSTPDPVTVDTTPLTFSQLSAQTAYTASNGVKLVGFDFQADLDPLGGLNLNGGGQIKINNGSEFVFNGSGALTLASGGISSTKLSSTQLQSIDAITTAGLIVSTGTTSVAKTLLPTSGNQVIVTNNPTNITLSLPQDIATTSTPTFNKLNLNNGTAFTSQFISSATANRSITFPDASGTVLLTGSPLFTLAGTSGTNSTISAGGTATLTAGTNITTTGNGAGAITFATVANPTFSTSTTSPLIIGSSTANSQLTLQSTSVGSGSTTDSIIFKTGNAGATTALTIANNGSVKLGNGTFTNGSLIFANSTNANTVTINSGVTSPSYTLTLPTAQATAVGQVLTNDMSGNLSWTTPSAGGGVGTGTANQLAFYTNSTTLSSTGFAPATADSAVSYVVNDLSGNEKSLQIGTLAAGKVPTGQLEVGGRKTPVLVGSVGSGSSNTADKSVYVQGRYAYVINFTSNTLQIFDVSNPAFPTALTGGTGGVVSAGSGPTSIYIQGRYAYVTDSNSPTLRIIDVSNPASPVSVGSASTDIFPYSVYVQGRYAYVANTNGPAQTLQIFDVSNPTSPVLAGSFSMGAGSDSFSIYVQGRYAYVVTNSSGKLKIIDISNPTSLILMNGLGASATNSNSIYVQGRYAYVVGGTTSGTFKIFDVSDPSTIAAPIFSVSTASNASIYVQGRYAYLVGNNGLQIYDVSNPTLAVNVQAGVSTPGAVSVYVQSRYAYITNGGTLSIFDLGGAYIQQLESGGLETGTLQTRSNATINNDLDVKGGVNIGIGGLYVDGPMASSNTLKLTGLATTVSTTPNVLCIETAAGATQFQVVRNVGGGTCTTSSRRFKHDIEDIDIGTDVLMKLRPVSFTYNGSNQKNIGFVAEEMEKIEPRLVFYEDDGTTPRGVKYENITALLTKAVQEQNLSLASMDLRIKALEDKSNTGISSGTPEEISVFSQFKAYLSNSEDKIISGIVHMEALVVNSLTVGSAEKPSGVTLYDFNGNPGCLILDSADKGTSTVVPGKCGDTPASTSTTGISSGTPEEIPVSSSTTTDTSSATSPLPSSMADPSASPSESVPSLPLSSSPADSSPSPDPALAP